jgi:hypothetical protein
MKNFVFLLIIGIIGFSCSQSADKSTDSYRSDSISAPTQVSQEMEKSAPSYASDEGGVNEKAKMESDAINTGESAKKTSSFSLTQNMGTLSDTVYLQNVRLSKKFIRTADLRFKVKQVEEATHKIEKLARDLNGYVYQSDIKSNRFSERNIELSPDSMQVVFEYVIENNLIIRVPNIHFDSIMNVIAKMHIFIDYRTVKTEDVSTTFLRNKLKAEKNAEYEKRIQRASDQGSRRLDDIVEAERQASEMADMAIDKKIANYELQDRIDFSTISLNIYQASSVYKETVKNTRLRSYQPNFWQRAWEAIRTGWNIILDIIIALIYLWPLYLLAVLIYFGIKYIRRWMKK